MKDKKGVNQGSLKLQDEIYKTMEYYHVEFTDNSTDRLIKNNKKKLRVRENWKIPMPSEYFWPEKH